ncbi:integrase, partial [Salmonella enterica]|nr:integrase [Salmonella enterica]EDR3922287.1 integrase [Salmonella enterica]
MAYYNIEKRLKSDDEPCYPSAVLLKDKSVI